MFNLVAAGSKQHINEPCSSCKHVLGMVCKVFLKRPFLSSGLIKLIKLSYVVYKALKNSEVMKMGSAETYRSKHQLTFTHLNFIQNRFVRI